MFFRKPVVLLYLLQLTMANKYDHVKPFFSPDVTRNYTLRIERNLCVDQPYKYFELLTCTVRLVRNEPSKILFAGRFLLRQDTVFCRYKVNYRFRTYQPFLLDEWFNYCDTFDNKFGKTDTASSFGQLAVGSLNSSISNLPGCPLEGLMNVTHVINKAQFPPFMPAGQYRLDMGFYNGQNETLFAFQTFLTVRAKGTADLAMG